METSSGDYLQSTWISDKEKKLASFEAALVKIPQAEVKECLLPLQFELSRKRTTDNKKLFTFAQPN